MADRILSDAVHYGRNPDLDQSRRDDRFVRCARCGFICHLDRDRRAPEGSRLGWGIKYSGEALYGVYDQPDIPYDTFDMVYDGYNDTQDPEVVAGCPQCGTYLYDK